MAHVTSPAKSKKRKNAGAGADWTVMVYLAGDNNLDGAGAADLREMKKVGSSASVNVIAQFDRAGSRFFIFRCDVDLALKHHMQARESAEAREGIAALNEKRKPN